MKIERGFEKITDCCAHDISRPILTHVLVIRTQATRGVVVAADGFILAAVPCRLEEEDQTGMIHWDRLRTAISMSKKLMKAKEYNADQAPLALTKHSILLRDGTSLPRWTHKTKKGPTDPTAWTPDIVTDNPIESQYPNFRNILRAVPRATPEEPNLKRFCANAGYIGKVGALVGGAQADPIILMYAAAETTPILIIPSQRSYNHDWGLFEGLPLPFGLVMPAHIGSNRREVPDGFD